MAERISRQLASVGDALAWRVYRYDRRAIIALSSNQQSGPFLHRKGLPYELGAIVERCKKGNFTLLHDLTSVIRHVDLTEVHPNGYRELHEVKANKGSSSTRQLREAQAALDAATGHKPLPRTPNAEVYLRRSTAAMRTTVRDLPNKIAIAERDGLYLGYHADRVITILEANRTVLSGADLAPEELDRRRDDLLQARWPNSPQFRANSGDKAALDPALAPYGIYPLPVHRRAQLICDHLIIESTITMEVLTAALARPGAQIEMVAPDVERDLDGGTPVLQIRSENRSLTIPMSVVSQLLLEFIDTRRWAQAVWETLDSTDIAHTVMTFTNERAAWS